MIQDQICTISDRRPPSNIKGLARSCTPFDTPGSQCWSLADRSDDLNKHFWTLKRRAKGRQTGLGEFSQSDGEELVIGEGDECWMTVVDDSC